MHYYARLLCLVCSFVSWAAYTSNDTDDTVDLQRYSIIFGGSLVGELTVESRPNLYKIQYMTDFNGRGMSGEETVTVNAAGVPLEWQISGKTMFGNQINESFTVADGIAQWQSVAGAGQAPFEANAVYVAQNGSIMYSPYIYARAILDSGKSSIPALPAGTLTLEEVFEVDLSSEQGETTAKLFALTGIELDPQYILLDKNNQFIGRLTSRFAVLRKEWAAEEQRLRGLVSKANVVRLNAIAKSATHQFDKPVRIRNVHVFEPQRLTVSPLQSVVIHDNKIVAIEAADAKSETAEVTIDGKGGYLFPGLYDMHGHISDQQALFNVLAGVTSVRDMGNEMGVIEKLIDDIEQDRFIGPRITKSAFIEGKSPFSSASGELAASEEEAVASVKKYAEKGGYHQIKIYNSIKGEWVPAMIAEAKKHNMRVSGHIPAFSKADEMIAAGYNEMTHINQVMLSWVLEREEDTRTLFRITGMQRFKDLDLSAKNVQHTLELMVKNNVAIDPTIVIHEMGLLSRNGEVQPALQNIIEHLPIAMQRNAKVAMLNIADEQEDEAYRIAFEKIIATLRMMHKKGIFIVPGTDLGGAYTLHRELMLFTQLGMTPAEAMKRGSYDMAEYLGYGEQLGSIEAGKLADFFLVEQNPLKDMNRLKGISMVVKDGNIYFPSEIYPKFGIKPFTPVPEVN